jgi:nicotinate-nucleotide adenylyltransferase
VKVALFGGTFDPIHSGHLQAARAAARRFQLDQILFVPSGHPPHKVSDHLTDFAHRYAMVVLACAGESRFVPSLLESPARDGRPRYSVYTARAVKRALEPKDELFFLMGVDALLDLHHWRDYRALLNLVTVIVVTRPGFDEREIWQVLPKDIIRPDHRPRPALEKPPSQGRRGEPHTSVQPGVLRLPQAALHILSGVHAPVASRDIRRAVAAGRSIRKLVPSAVESYISKEGLYGATKGWKSGGRPHLRELPA